MNKPLTPKILIAETGLHKDVIYDMLRDPTCPVIRYGSKYLIARAAWDGWFAQGHIVERTRRK